MNWKRLVSPLVLLVLWHLVSELGIVGSHLLPSPCRVLGGLKTLVVTGMPPGHLLDDHLYHSLQRVFAGYAVAVVLAVPMGVAMGWYDGFRNAAEPLVEIFRPIPPLAWIPISILWFGIGMKSSAFIIFLGAFFPILLNTVAGVRAVDPLWIDVGRSLNAGRGDILFKILTPAAAPGIVTGMRIGIGIGWMSLVAAEFSGVREGFGLGYMIMTARDIQRSDLVIAGMLVIGAIGLCMDCCFRWLEERFGRR